MADMSSGYIGNDDNEFRFSSDMTLEDIRASQAQFSRERNWGKFHMPRNILLAMVGEVGELSEIFQWKGEVEEGLPEFTDAEKLHVGEEISDILIYLVDLAAKCHIDLPAALYDKMQKNASKYPVAACNGPSSSSGSGSCTQKYSIYGDERSLVGSSIPEREREEGDGSE